MGLLETSVECGDLFFPTFKTCVIFAIWSKRANSAKKSQNIGRKLARKFEKNGLKMEKIEIAENENVENSRGYFDEMSSGN